LSSDEVLAVLQAIRSGAVEKKRQPTSPVFSRAGDTIASRSTEQEEEGK